MRQYHHHAMKVYTHMLRLKDDKLTGFENETWECSIEVPLQNTSIVCRCLYAWHCLLGLRSGRVVTPLVRLFG